MRNSEKYAREIADGRPAIVAKAARRNSFAVLVHAHVVAHNSLYWEGNKANMKYSISRKSS